MPYKLLVADDSATMQKVVEITFSAEDVQLIKASTGQEALLKAKETRPDCLLLDVTLPGGDGYTVCQHLKSDADLAAIPVVLMCSTAQPYDDARAQSVGIHAHVVKPFETQVLIDRVLGVLGATPRVTAAEDTVAQALRPSVALQPTLTPTTPPAARPAAMPSAANAPGAKPIPAAPFVPKQGPLFTPTPPPTVRPGVAPLSPATFPTSRPATTTPLGFPGIRETPSRPSLFGGGPQPAPRSPGGIPMPASGAPRPTGSFPKQDLPFAAAKTANVVPPASIHESFSPADFDIEMPSTKAEAPVAQQQQQPRPHAVDLGHFRPATQPPASAPLVDSGAAKPQTTASLDAEVRAQMKEMIEQVIWEVVPTLAETMIREHLERLLREKQV